MIKLEGTAAVGGKRKHLNFALRHATINFNELIILIQLVALLEQIQGGLFHWYPLKVLCVGLHSKSHKKSFKCQNLLNGWHLDFLGGYQ